MGDTLAIQVQVLHRSFGRNRAVDGVSFDVFQGEIFSLLPQRRRGHGSSTLMRTSYSGDSAFPPSCCPALC
jgi:ABC-type transporter Mla maintaining outer membrane lipid asymmetry ATPase subunit MlaF